MANALNILAIAKVKVTRCRIAGQHFNCPVQICAHNVRTWEFHTIQLI